MLVVLDQDVNLEMFASLLSFYALLYCMPRERLFGSLPWIVDVSITWRASTGDRSLGFLRLNLLVYRRPEEHWRPSQHRPISRFFNPQGQQPFGRTDGGTVPLTNPRRLKSPHCTLPGSLTPSLTLPHAPYILLDLEAYY